MNFYVGVDVETGDLVAKAYILKARVGGVQTQTPQIVLIVWKHKHSVSVKIQSQSLKANNSAMCYTYVQVK